MGNKTMKESSNQAAKEEFNLHIEHITATHSEFIGNTAKVASFLLLALGWFVTSSDVRVFLASSYSISIIAATAVAAAYLLSVAASWVAYQVSNNIALRLRELAYLPPSAYEERMLSKTTFVSCVAGNGVISALLIIALLTVSYEAVQ